MGLVNSCLMRRTRSDSCMAKRPCGRVEVPATFIINEANKRCSEFASVHAVYAQMDQSNDQEDFQPEQEMVTHISDLLDEMKFEGLGNLQLFDVGLESPVTDQKELTGFPSTSEEVEEPTELVLSGVELDLPVMDQVALKLPAEDLVEISRQPPFCPKPQTPSSQLIEEGGKNEQKPQNEDRPKTLHQRWNKYRNEAKIKRKEKVKRKYQDNWVEFEQKLEKMNAKVDKDMKMHQIREKQILEYMRKTPKNPVKDKEEPSVLTEVHQWWNKTFEELRVKRKENAKRKYQEKWEEFDKRLENMNAQVDKDMEMFQKNCKKFQKRPGGMSGQEAGPSSRL